MSDIAPAELPSDASAMPSPQTKRQTLPYRDSLFLKANPLRKVKKVKGVKIVRNTLAE
jgi:hypothetical protein